jgi:hypothetical protein
MNFFAEIGIKDENKGIEIIELLVKTGKLDKELWEKHRVIVSGDFLLSIRDAYKKRNNEVITIEEIRGKFQKGCDNPVSAAVNPVSAALGDTEIPQNGEFEAGNPQSKVKKRKVKERKAHSGCAGNDCGFSKTPKKPRLREREPVNDTERVEKAYLRNWDALYSQKQVNTPEPIENWNRIRKLLKTHFAKLKPEQIIQAIDNGMKNDFVLNCGYSLSVMLSASVLNRLINTVEPKCRHEKPSLE